MSYVLLSFIFFTVPLVASAQSESSVETYIFSNSTSGGTVKSSVKTSGNAEVRIRTVINGEVVEDLHVEGAETYSRETRTPLVSPDIRPVEVERESDRTHEADESDDEDPGNPLLSSFFEHLRLPQSLFALRENAGISPEETKESWPASMFSSIRRFIMKFF